MMIFRKAIPRRTFLQALGSGLLITVATPRAWAEGTPVSARVFLNEDGTVTALSGKVEEGQGPRTELTQAAAEELRVPVEQVRLVMADTDLVPRRATVHDVGSGLTHKRIICRKRYLEGKSSDEIARETYHSLEAVDRYLGTYDRVRHCHLEGLAPGAIAYTLNCSLSLVQEYLAINQELEARHA